MKTALNAWQLHNCDLQIDIRIRKVEKVIFRLQLDPLAALSSLYGAVIHELASSTIVSYSLSVLAYVLLAANLMNKQIR